MDKDKLANLEALVSAATPPRGQWLATEKAVTKLGAAAKTAIPELLAYIAERDAKWTDVAMRYAKLVKEMKARIERQQECIAKLREALGRSHGQKFYDKKAGAEDEYQVFKPNFTTPDAIIAEYSTPKEGEL